MNSPATVAVDSPKTAASNGEMLYEVVNGQIVESFPMGAFEVNVASLIHAVLAPFAAQHRLGRAVMEMLFVLNAVAGLRRRPDVAFVSYERWPRNRRVPRTEAWDVVPDLAIEVISESNMAEEILGKIREYFEAGVRRVWVFYPTEELVYDYTSPTKNIILTRDDELDGAEVVPGFRLPLRRLYEEQGDEPAN